MKPFIGKLRKTGEEVLVISYVGDNFKTLLCACQDGTFLELDPSLVLFYKFY